MDDKNKVYLGDGVYLSTKPDNGLLLTAENGADLFEKIYLEPEVQQELLKQLTEYLRSGKLR